MSASLSALLALYDPTKPVQIANILTKTSEIAAKAFLKRLLLCKEGRDLLKNKPQLNIPSTQRIHFASGSLGSEYFKFMQVFKLSSEERSLPMEIIISTKSHTDAIVAADISYIITRYRQIHDFWHVISGFTSIDLKSELALKVWEWRICGFPVALISSLFGPARLFSITGTPQSKSEFNLFYQHYLKWALQANSDLKLFYADYEKLLSHPIGDVRKAFDIVPFSP